jgi:hypothetical protein
MVDAARSLKAGCKKSICLIDEMWIKQMDPHRHFLRILADFDLVVLYYSQSVGPLQERIGRRCIFLPPGVDSIRFCPYPTPPQRAVDVYSVGRRSQKTHQALLEAADRSNLFYVYDSISGLKAVEPREHRSLFANIAKRTRYFIVNPGLIDRSDRRGAQIEIGNRYFEGAAAGTIMIGEPPANEVFGKLFDWKDAVIPVPFNSENLHEIIDELDQQPERLEVARQTNIFQSLSRHDWVYRWEAMLREVGLEPMPEMSIRKNDLRRLADFVSNDAGGRSAQLKISCC